MTQSTKFPLPQFLQGTITAERYDSWLEERASTLYHRDLRRKRPYALDGSNHLYREKINEAVLSGSQADPFTGDKLRWDLVKTWDPAKNIGHNDFMKDYRLMPTVDHVDPYADVLELEICSWRINCCKAGLTPQEFTSVCDAVAKMSVMSTHGDK